MEQLNKITDLLVVRIVPNPLRRVVFVCLMQSDADGSMTTNTKTFLCHFGEERTSSGVLVAAIIAEVAVSRPYNAFRWVTRPLIQ